MSRMEFRIYNNEGDCVYLVRSKSMFQEVPRSFRTALWYLNYYTEREMQQLGLELQQQLALYQLQIHPVSWELLQLTDRQQQDFIKLHTEAEIKGDYSHLVDQLQLLATTEGVHPVTQVQLLHLVMEIESEWVPQYVRRESFGIVGILNKHVYDLLSGLSRTLLFHAENGGIGYWK